MSKTLCTNFQTGREIAGNFCRQRNWTKFHTPNSLVLALSGECGEVCAIFQWKSTLAEDLKSSPLEKILSEKEYINIGEEVADVLIYTTRLCDTCGVDLGAAVHNELNNIKQTPETAFLPYASFPWKDIDFDTVVNGITNHKPTLYPNIPHRYLCLQLQAEVGKLCNLFASYPEVVSLEVHGNGLTGWLAADRAAVASHVATIALIVITIAYISKLSIGKCIIDKFAKNEAKYPVALCKDSSAKYTAYQHNNNNQPTKTTTSIAAMDTWSLHRTMIVTSVIGGLCFLWGKYTR